LTREQSQQTILFTLHYTAAGRRQIIVTGQMQDTVDEVTDQLGLPGGAKLSSLLHGVIEANEDFSVKSILPAVVEGDDVSGTGMTEELLVDPGHLWRSDEMDGELAPFQ